MSNRLLKYSFFMLTIILFLMVQVSCSKDDTKNSLIKAETLRVYENREIGEVFDIVAGEGVALLVYVDFTQQYKFKLIDLNGNEIWDKSFGIPFEQFEDKIVEVLHEPDNTFTIVIDRRLVRINYQGVIIQDIDSFTGLSDSYSFTSFTLANNGNYLVLGTAFLSGNRAFFGEYTKNGEEVFRDLFSVNVTGSNTFGSILKQNNSTYLVGGAFTSLNPNLENQIFIIEYSLNGERLSEHYYNISEHANSQLSSFSTNSCKGLFTTSNGDLLFASNAFVDLQEDQGALLFKINSSWTIDKVQRLNLSSSNSLGLTNNGLGDAIIKRPDGSFLGVVHEEINLSTSFNNDIAMNFEAQTYSYLFELNREGKIVGMEFINRNYANTFIGICELSDGRLAMLGKILSFGENNKLAVLIR